MDTAIVLFTRDLRLHDNPALAGACARARQVVPLFVVDPALTVPPNRARFLADSLAVLRQEMRERGGDLVIRKGDPVAETIRLATRTCSPDRVRRRRCLPVRGTARATPDAGLRQAPDST